MASYTDFFGLRIREEFEQPDEGGFAMSSGRWRNDLFGYLDGEDLYEFAFLEHAIKASGPLFQMVELGCGYGRWLGTAWYTIRHRLGDSSKRIALLGVDPSEGRKNWFFQYMADNAIDADKKTAIYFGQYGVGPGEGHAGWKEKEPISSYGQGIGYGDETIKVKSINNLLLPGRIDYLSMDIQGMEILCMRHQKTLQALVERVAFLHIATHDNNDAKEIVKTLQNLGLEHHLSVPKDMLMTERGFYFIDGMEQFVNPFLLTSTTFDQFAGQRSKPQPLQA